MQARSDSRSPKQKKHPLRILNPNTLSLLLLLVTDDILTSLNPGPKTKKTKQKKGLLAAEDYLGALDILQLAKATVKSDLGKLQSLKHVGRKLTEYEELVSDLLSNRFVTLAVTIPVDTSAGGGGGTAGGSAEFSWDTTTTTTTTTSTPEAGNGGARAENGARGTAGGGAISAGGDELRREVELTVQGLLRLGEMERVLGVVQERVSEDLKLIIRFV